MHNVKPAVRVVVVVVGRGGGGGRRGEGRPKDRE